MREWLLKEFEEKRNLLIETIYKSISVCNKKSIFLDGEYHYILDSEHIVTQKYKRLYIDEREAIMIEFESGDGFMPYKFEHYSEGIEMFSLNEIYDIIVSITE